MNFMGYIREDRQVGVRNHVIVLSSVSCVNPITEKISRLTGAIPITHGYGCDQAEEDSLETEWCLARYAENPNVAAAFVVGLGCEQIDANRLAEEIKGRPTDCVKVAEEGANGAEVKGVKKVREMIEYASMLKREEVPLTKLILNVQCGGSDTTSGIASNPALGVASDLLIKEGGTVLLDDVAFGEHFLLKNVSDSKIIKELWRATEVYAEKIRMHPTTRGINPTPGNLKQGLTTLTEKRLGGIMKGGSTPLRGILTYRDRPSESGLYYTIKSHEYVGFSDTCEATMKLLQGPQINCFTTGWGNPMGLAIAPVIKITANQITFERNKENMDINASKILYGKETLNEVGNKIFNKIIEVANGKLTKSEIREHRDFLLPMFFKELAARAQPCPEALARSKKRV